MSEEAILKQLNEFVATVELSIQDWNTFVNVLNTPQQTQVIVNARLIDVLQNQSGFTYTSWSDQANKSATPIDLIIHITCKSNIYIGY